MTTALVREHEMTTKARGLLAAQVEADAAVGRARALAATVRGVVVTTEAESAAVADTALGIAQGIAAVERARKAVLEIPREVEGAVNRYAKGILDELRAAKASCDSATAGYLIRRRQEQERELAAQREQAAREALEVAAETGEESVPLEAPEAVKPQTMVRGAAGSQGLVEVLKCEWTRAPHRWAMLDQAAAKAWFRDECKSGRLPRPALGADRVVAEGVAFWVEATVATRRA